LTLFRESTIRYKIGELSLELAGESTGLRRTRFLQEAIEALKLALSCSEESAERAIIWHKLGDSFSQLAKHTNNSEVSENLSYAVNAYEEALRFTTPGSRQDAELARGLGLALVGLGKLTTEESGKNLYEKALSAYERSHLFFTREENRNEWAAIQRLSAAALTGLAISERAGRLDHLVAAVIACRGALESAPTQELPEGWAETQKDLANGLQALAQRKSTRKAIRDAVRNIRSAAVEFDLLREADPQTRDFSWAGSNSLLGLGLCALAFQVDGSKRFAYLTTGAKALESALAVDAWAETAEESHEARALLATVLSELATTAPSEDSRGLLDRAAKAHRVLADNWPVAWPLDEKVAALVRTGDMYRDLAMGGARCELLDYLDYLYYLDAAEGAFREALRLLCRREQLGEKARVGRKLGELLLARGRSSDHEQAIECFQQALGAFNAASEAYTPELERDLWADVQNEIAASFLELGLRLPGEEGKNSLSKAATAARAVVELLSGSAPTRALVGALKTLGSSLKELGGHSKGAERERLLLDALAVFQRAQKLVDREQELADWASLGCSVGNTFADLASLSGEDTAHYSSRAITAFEEVLGEETRTRLPAIWSETQCALGDVYTELALAESGTSRVELSRKAAQAYDHALEGCDHRAQWEKMALIRIRLGDIRSSARWKLGYTSHIWYSNDCAGGDYKKALELLTPQKHPEDWAYVQMRLRPADDASSAIEEWVSAVEASGLQNQPAKWKLIRRQLKAFIESVRIQEGGFDEIAPLERLLGLLSRDEEPDLWAGIRVCMGIAAHREGMQVEGGLKSLQDAIEAFQDALEVLAVRGNPQRCAVVRKRLREAAEEMADRTGFDGGVGGVLDPSPETP